MQKGAGTCSDPRFPPGYEGESEFISSKALKPSKDEKSIPMLRDAYQNHFGGPYRDRTDDLLHAMEALSQLS